MMRWVVKAGDATLNIVHPATLESGRPVNMRDRAERLRDDWVARGIFPDDKITFVEEDV